MAAAALLGALLDAVALIIVYSGIGMRILVIFVFVAAELLISARIAYGKQALIQNSLLLFGITALFAGLLQLVPIRNVGLFCIIGALLLPCLVNGVRVLFRTGQVRQMLYEGVLYYNKQEKCVSAFMDTGNRLCFFGSGIPVVLVDEEVLSDWIREAERISPQKLVFLPYKGVGGKGLLRGVRLQCKIITEKDGDVKGEVAAVAAEHRLFHGCQYQMILQPEVLSMVCVRDTQEGA